MKIILAAPFWLLTLIFCISCRTVNPLPPADLSTPGWHIQQGQAVWQPPGNRPEMTGDLLLATNANGNFFLQFTKDPFPLASAEVMDGCWQVSFGMDEHAWRGQGAPPSRFVWFQLPPALLSGKTTGTWRFSSSGTNLWRLENLRTGEYLEGGFFP
jgi:hypothetical protein